MITKNLNIIILLIFIFSCEKIVSNVANNAPPEIPSKDKKIYYDSIELFNEEKYEAALLKLKPFISGYANVINYSSVYTYAYFMVGYIYEKEVYEKEDPLVGELSIANYQTYLKLNQHDKYTDRAYEGIARVRYQMDIDKYQEDILANIDKSLQINPNNSSVLRLKGNCHFYLKEYDQSIESFKQSLSKNPNSEWSYIGLASAYARRGEDDDIKRAIKNYEKALIINPDNKTAQTNKAKLLNELLKVE